MDQFISLQSVWHALKERAFWSCCAALSTSCPLAIGPNLRILRGTALWGVCIRWVPAGS
jgi:hypothetical protein